MNTKEILKEWRNFLLEASSKVFNKNDEGKKVIVKDCCGNCHKMYDNVPKKGHIEGTLKVINLPDREDKKNPGKKINFVLVSISKDTDKSFPECCVELKDEKS